MGAIKKNRGYFSFVCSNSTDKRDTELTEVRLIKYCLKKMDKESKAVTIDFTICCLFRFSDSIYPVSWLVYYGPL